MAYTMAEIKEKGLVLKPGQVVIVREIRPGAQLFRGVVATHEPGETPILVNYQKTASRSGALEDMEEFFIVPTPVFVRWFNVVRCIWPLGVKFSFVLRS